MLSNFAPPLPYYYPLILGVGVGEGLGLGAGLRLATSTRAGNNLGWGGEIRHNTTGSCVQIRGFRLTRTRFRRDGYLIEFPYAHPL